MFVQDNWSPSPHDQVTREEYRSGRKVYIFKQHLGILNFPQ